MKEGIKQSEYLLSILSQQCHIINRVYNLASNYLHIVPYCPIESETSVEPENTQYGIRIVVTCLILTTTSCHVPLDRN